VVAQRGTSRGANASHACVIRTATSSTSVRPGCQNSDEGAAPNVPDPGAPASALRVSAGRTEPCPERQPARGVGPQAQPTDAERLYLTRRLAETAVTD
jgi:hypothetical protein